VRRHRFAHVFLRGDQQRGIRVDRPDGAGPGQRPEIRRARRRDREQQVVRTDGLQHLVGDAGICEARRVALGHPHEPGVLELLQDLHACGEIG
jgi:hypothetical protein